MLHSLHRHSKHRACTRLLVRPLLILACAATLAACSTTEGFGKDVKNLGGGIEDSAARNK
jgi:predicted small secreted protein